MVKAKPSSDPEHQARVRDTAHALRPLRAASMLLQRLLRGEETEEPGATLSRRSGTPLFTMAVSWAQAFGFRQRPLHHAVIPYAPFSVCVRSPSVFVSQKQNSHPKFLVQVVSMAGPSSTGVNVETGLARLSVKTLVQ